MHTSEEITLLRRTLFNPSLCLLKNYELPVQMHLLFFTLLARMSEHTFFNPAFPELSSLATAPGIIQFPRHSTREKPINLLLTNLVWFQRETRVFIVFSTRRGVGGIKSKTVKIQRFNFVFCPAIIPFKLNFEGKPPSLRLFNLPPFNSPGASNAQRAREQHASTSTRGRAASWEAWLQCSFR